MRRAVLPLASGSVFSARGRLRILEYNDENRFIPSNELTRQQIADCSALGDVYASEVHLYIAEYGGIPGIVKGVLPFSSGMTVFSENLKYMTVVCSARVSGNKIKFNYGAEERKEERSDCWEFCVKRHRIKVITEVEKLNGIEYPLVLTREETECPVCKEDLSGNVVTCNEKHQVCLPCFNLLPVSQGVKKCPLCNVVNYSIDEYQKVERMNGQEIQSVPYLYLDLKSGSNSFKDYMYNEALFLHMIKNELKCNNMDIYRNMLMSSLHNYYFNHEDKFNTYNFNFTHYSDDNNRRLNPMEDEPGNVITHYIDDIYKPDESKKIYDDIAYTNVYMQGYDDIQFYRELEEIEGNVNRIVEYPNDRKPILQREIYFRYKISKSNKNELLEYIKNILRMILQNSSRFNYVFENIKRRIN